MDVKGVSVSVEINTTAGYRSFSSLNSYLSCQKQWQLSRIAKVTERPSWWLAGGKAVHTATEVFDRQVFEETGR